MLLPALLHPRVSFCSSATLREFPGDADKLRCTASSAAPAALLQAQLQAKARFCSGAAVREVPAEGAGQLSFAARPAQAGQQAVYMVDIITGNVRGAGTEARQTPADMPLLLRLALELSALMCTSACLTEEVACPGVQAPAVIRLIGSEGQSEEYVLGARLAFLPLADRGVAVVARYYSAAPLPWPCFAGMFLCPLAAQCYCRQRSGRVWL